MRFSVVWLRCYRLFKIGNASPKPIDGPSLVYGPEISLVSFRTDNPRILQGSLLLRSKFYANLVSYCTGHLVLQAKHVAHITLKGFGPEVPVCASLNQLSGNTNAVA